MVSLLYSQWIVSPSLQNLGQPLVQLEVDLWPQMWSEKWKYKAFSVTSVQFLPACETALNEINFAFEECSKIPNDTNDLSSFPDSFLSVLHVFRMLNFYHVSSIFRVSDIGQLPTKPFRIPENCGLLIEVK